MNVSFHSPDELFGICRIFSLVDPLEQRPRVVQMFIGVRSTRDERQEKTNDEDEGSHVVDQRNLIAHKT